MVVQKDIDDGDDPLWYKDSIIYELHVKAFFDSNNDGVGDYPGLTAKLDYIADLGVNTIWLLPFYPSPMRDDGYDISDYRNIYPAYGSRRDFREFVREAHRRGIKIITELIINHTSDQHPWFQAARRAPYGSAKRDFYVWSDTVKKFQETRIIFTDTENSNWAWDDVAKAYYWHRFFSHQPDLNHNNPEVVKAIIRVMRFWLDLGVDGLRLDAIPYLCVREGTTNENLAETHAVIRQMRAVVDAHYSSRVFLAEANQWPEDVRDYFGEGDECHMAYHFPLMPRMYMAVAQEDRHPVVEIMGQTPEIPDNCQWAIFLRNHDELTLEMVTSRERDYMYEMYANDPRMRLNIGIRRRLAPLMNNDPDKIKLMNSLLMSMPGSPIIYYGDEIGMGDNVYLGDRNGVRTPMQWSPDRSGGFSKADPQRLFLPVIMDPIYGYESVNVEAQNRDPSSLLNWMKRMIAIRKAYKAFGRGSLEFLHPRNRKIIAYLRHYQDEYILCVANLSRTAQPVELDLSRYSGRVPIEMMGRTAFPPIGELPYFLTLSSHGVYWFLLATANELAPWHEERIPPNELPLLVLFEGWRSFFPEEVDPSRRLLAEKLRKQLEQEVLPVYLASQRWFSAKTQFIERIELQHPINWIDSKAAGLLLWLVVHFKGNHPAQKYFVPLTLAWEETEEKIHGLLHSTLARVRQRGRIGVIRDAFTDERFCGSLVQAIANNLKLSSEGVEVDFFSTKAFSDLNAEVCNGLPLQHPSNEGTNTGVILGDTAFLKVYRRVREGLNPELEMGLFLTEQSPFGHIVPVAGGVEIRHADGSSATLAILQKFSDNQGDAWTYTIDYLERFFENCLAQTPDIRSTSATDIHAAYLQLIRLLGQRTGEFHQALAKPTGNSAFEPEQISSKDIDSWITSSMKQVDSAFTRLAELDTSHPLFSTLQQLIKKRPALHQQLPNSALNKITSVKIRVHGDYHLGQILIVKNDLFIIDLEGEPAKEFPQRREKHSPLRDIAGMLRSFDYAANAALIRLTTERPNDLITLKPFAESWQQLSSHAFLEGYNDHSKNENFYVSDEDSRNALIRLFVMEKLCYEICYELDNRPEWLQIPLRGLLDLIQLDD